MTSHDPRSTRWATPRVLCFAALLLAACERSAPTTPPAPPAATAADPAPPAHVYEGVLGVVSQVPVAGQPSTSFKIHHEHIPTFRSPATGQVNVNANGSTGMRAMTMEMPPADGVDVSSLAIGDKVRFTFAVWTQPRVSWRVTSIEKLPPDTAIDFADKPAAP